MLDFKIFNTYITFLLNQQKKSDKLDKALNEYNKEFLQLNGMFLPYEEKMIELIRDAMGLKEKDDEFLWEFLSDPFRKNKSNNDIKKLYQRIKRIVNEYNKKSKRKME